MSHQIRTVAVIGCGVIGSSWACLFLSRGLKVIMYDPAVRAQETFKQYLQEGIAFYASQRRFREYPSWEI